MAAMWTFALARLAGILLLGLCVGLLIGPIWVWILGSAWLYLGWQLLSLSGGPLAAPAFADRPPQHRRNLGRHHRPGHPPASPQAVSQAASGTALPGIAPFHRRAARRSHHFKSPARDRLVQSPGRAIVRLEAAGGRGLANRQPDSRPRVCALPAQR